MSDLWKIERKDLVRRLGKWGNGLYEKARGVGEEVLSGPEEAKSIGAQETFDKDISSMRTIFAETKRIAKDVFDRFQKKDSPVFVPSFLPFGLQILKQKHARRHRA